MLLYLVLSSTITVEVSILHIGIGPWKERKGKKLRTWGLAIQATARNSPHALAFGIPVQKVYP